MFFYLYDSFISNPKNEQTCNQVEARLIELGINGRIERLSPLRNIKELLKNGLKQGAHTIVVVGDDTTFLRTMNIIADKDVALGYIPFNSKTGVAKILGIPSTFEACDILSRRMINTVPLIKVNQNYVFNTVTIDNAPPDLNINCNGKYSVSSSEHHTVRITNLDTTTTPEKQNSTMTVELIPAQTRRTKKITATDNPGYSALLADTVKVTHNNTPVAVLLDGITTLKTPLSITRQPNKLKLIVGKNRLLS